MSVEKKWQANEKKVSFARGFPGQLSGWEAARGKEISHVVTIEGRSVSVIVFTDETFIIHAVAHLSPADLILALLTSRSLLEAYYPEAYMLLDGHIAEDRELQRMARLENIIGAVRNNLPQIPELKETLKRFLEEQG